MAWRGTAGQVDVAWLGVARLGMARQVDTARQGRAWQGQEGRGKARQVDEERRGWAGHGRQSQTINGGKNDLQICKKLRVQR